MKQVLVFGSGGTVAVLQHCLTRQPQQYNLINIHEVPADETERRSLIKNADVVISLTGPDQQHLIAQDCIDGARHLITPSGLGEKIMNLRPQAEAANVLFLYEMGFDPGLDHMSALQSIHHIHEQGGNITSFQSHSGTLVAPEHDDNPWHFKTADAAALIEAGREGAIYKEKNAVRHLQHQQVFNGSRLVEFPGVGFLSWYPAPDSMGYIPLYGLIDAETVIRTTLCHPDFMYGWKNVTDLQLTGTIEKYDTDGMSLADFFKTHFDRHGFSGWLEKKMMERFSQTKQILEKLMQFMEVEQAANEGEKDFPENLLMVDDKGKLGTIDLEEVKDKAAAMVAYKMHEANLTLKQLFFLGMDDQDTMINQGTRSAAEVLHFALQKKLALQPHERDMVVMMQEIEYELGNNRSSVTRTLSWKGDESSSASDTITGLCLAIAADQLLSGNISLKGLHIPVLPEIYEPVLKGLSEHGIIFREEHKLL